MARKGSAEGAVVRTSTPSGPERRKPVSLKVVGEGSPRKGRARNVERVPAVPDRDAVVAALQQANAAIEAAEKLPDIIALKAQLEAALAQFDLKKVEGMPEGARAYLAEMAKISEEASSIAPDDREAFFASSMQRLGLARDRASGTTEKVAGLIFDAQTELEQKEHLPLPQRIETFRKENWGKEAWNVIWSSGAKVTLGVAEGGMMATLALWLRERIWGEHFPFLSPEHVGSTLLITAAVAPLIEAGASAATSDPIQQGGSYLKNLAKVARKRGPLALALTTLAAAASLPIQEHTLAIGLGNAAEMQGVVPMVKNAKESVETQINELGPAGAKVVTDVHSAEDEILDAEINVVHKAGRGGSGQATLGPVAAFKIGFLFNGTWSEAQERKYGAIPATEKVQAALKAGREARSGVLSDSLGEDVAKLYASFETDTKGERALILEKFKAMGATAGEIDFWLSNPAMVKFALTIGFTPPGQPVVDREKRETLEHLMKLQERHEKLVADVNAVLKRASDALTKAAAAAGREEGAIDIEAHTVTFDTSAMDGIVVPEALQITDFGSPYVEGADHYYGAISSEAVRVAMWAATLTAVVGFLLYGSRTLMGLANRRRYQSLRAEAEAGYNYLVDKEGGDYLKKFSELMSARMSALFAGEESILANPEARAQLKDMTNRDWIDLSPEMIRVAFLEAAADQKAINSTGNVGMWDGLVNTYLEGAKHHIDRGTPPEVIAQNAVTALLAERPELAMTLVNKLFPGYFEFERLLDRKQGKGGTPTEHDVAELDSRFYPMIAGHLEQRLEIERTELAWCFRAFKDEKLLQELGVGSLDDLNEAPVDLLAAGSFDATGLDAQKLAGSAVRRATINALSARIREARENIEKIKELAHGLRFSAGAKAKLLKRSGDRAEYRAIDALVEKADKAKPYERSGAEYVSGLTPRGSIENAARDTVLADIREKMGLLTEEETREDYATLHGRIAKQFGALSIAARRLWSWESAPVLPITPNMSPEELLGAKRNELSRAALVNDAYRQQATFQVIEANEEEGTPAPSYGVKFSIIHKESGTEVTSVRYSLAQTFSERLSEGKIVNNFRKKLRARSMYNASKVYADRIERALANSRTRYGTRPSLKSIDLGSKNGTQALDGYFGTYLPHMAGHAYLNRLSENYRSLQPDLPKPSVEVEDDAPVSDDARMGVEVADRFRKLAETAEAFTVPPLGEPMTRVQLDGMARQLEDRSMRGAKITLDFEHSTARLTKPGVLGTPLAAKTLTLSISEFKNTYEDRNQDLKRAFATIFAKRR